MEDPKSNLPFVSHGVAKLALQRNFKPKAVGGGKGQNYNTLARSRLDRTLWVARHMGRKPNGISIMGKKREGGKGRGGL